MSRWVWLVVVGAAASLCIVTSYGSLDSDSPLSWQSHDLPEENQVILHQRNSSLKPHSRQKRLFGLVAAGISIAGMFMSRKAAEQAAKRHEESMKLALEQICMGVCVGEWTMWNECDKPCGGGLRNRTRVEQHDIGKCSTISYTCPHSPFAEERCNTRCPHGGTPGSDTFNDFCICKPGWRGPCCIEEAMCKFPGNPRNGRIHGTWPARYRAVATFTCNSGYAVDDAQTKDTNDWIVCEDDHTKENPNWSGEKPNCGRIYCKQPEKRDDKVKILNPPSGDGYRVGEDIFYMCDDGYSMYGPEKRTCQPDEGLKGRWTGFDPICKAVKCEDPGIPLFGQREGTKLTFGSTVNFTCDSGYKLLGSKTMNCMASGRWLGRFPECQQINCDPPLVPKHGDVLLRKKTFGSLVSFICDDGYILEGSRSLKCQADGNWNGTEPRCKAADCGKPGGVNNGASSGNVFYYPFNVTFTCHNGYQLQGSSLMSCQQNGVWSSPVPTCKACAKHTYMDDIKSPGKCTPCPANTYTVTVGSTSKLQCICITGFTGPPGGPCQEIRCEDLSAPEFGELVEECDNKLNQSCYFACDEGYTIDKGSSMRTCQENGQWDGEDPTCAPCPENTYKEDERSCQPCPRHSHTVGEANVLRGCVCDEGYKGPAGGPCTDVNECEPNMGKGPCSDACENHDGSYKCRCPIVGHKIDPQDMHKCLVNETCKNLTSEDAPINGGLVCHWFFRHNSQQCIVKCNPGYEFPSRVNAYESCGSTTGFIWTFRQEDFTATIDPCIKELFPGFRLEGEAYYFVSSCNSLTPEEQTYTKEQFATILNEAKICENRNTKVCSIKDMAIICGREERRRRKRGVMTVEHSLDLIFNITGDKQFDWNTKEDCPTFCRNFGLRDAKVCDKVCLSLKRRVLKATMENAKFMLSNEKMRQQMRMRIQSMEAEPERPLKVSDLLTDCQENMVILKGSCVPCSPGTFFDGATRTCRQCSPGHYQILTKQDHCLECPVGTTTYKRGATGCIPCRKGTFGRQCAEKCPKCVHGRCNPVIGECECDSGYEGDLCEKDIDGCANANCFKGVQCIDKKAPASGFSCGPCPSGFHGDGADCVPNGKALPARKRR